VELTPIQMLFGGTLRLGWWVLWSSLLYGCAGANPQLPDQPSSKPAPTVDVSQALDDGATANVAAATDAKKGATPLSWENLVKTPEGLQVPEDALPEVVRSWVAGVSFCEITEEWRREAGESDARSISFGQPHLPLDYQAIATQLLQLDGWTSVPFTEEEEEDHYVPGPYFKVSNGATTVIGDAAEFVITTPQPLPSTDEWADSQGSFGALAAKVEAAVGVQPSFLSMTCALRGVCSVDYAAMGWVDEKHDKELSALGLERDKLLQSLIWDTVSGTEARLQQHPLKDEVYLYVHEARMPGGVSNQRCYRE